MKHTDTGGPQIRPTDKDGTIDEDHCANICWKIYAVNQSAFSGPRLKQQIMPKMVTNKVRSDG